MDFNISFVASRTSSLLLRTFVLVPVEFVTETRTLPIHLLTDVVFSGPEQRCLLSSTSAAVAVRLRSGEVCTLTSSTCCSLLSTSREQEGSLSYLSKLRVCLPLSLSSSMCMSACLCLSVCLTHTHTHTHTHLSLIHISEPTRRS